MMRTLYLMRHAKSSWSDPGLGDRERPLNKRGRDAAARMARYMADMGIRPQAVLCSGALRTRETLALIRPALPETADVTVDDGLYLAGAGALLEKIQAIGEAVSRALVIAHEPGLTDLALTLAGRDRDGERHRIEQKFPTAALAGLAFEAATWRAVAPGKGDVTLFVVPKALDRPR